MKHLITRCSSAIAVLAVALRTAALSAQAAVYGGGGLNAGASEAAVIVGNENIRERIVDIIRNVLLFMGLAAVVVIVIAGILMIVSGGEEEAQKRAKRIILYAVIGLIIIILARGLVEFVAGLAE